MKAPRPAVVDFETLGINGRPLYPPAPVGVSVKLPGKPARYYAFGHAEGNNATWGEARAAVAEAYAAKDGVLFQNGKFDLDVAEVHMGLDLPPWTRVHDTMFLLFLDDPHQKELGLKPSAERLLGEPPEERDEVVDWLIANQPVPGAKITKSRISEHAAGRYIAYAPAELVGRYANGDTDRTWKLFQLLYPRIVERGMLAAYNRERELMPILLEMERQGIAVDLPRLRADVALYKGAHAKLAAWIRKRLKTPELNIDSGDELIEALLKTRKVDESQLLLTKTGKYSTSKDGLIAAVSDKQLLSVLQYFSQLSTCLRTFMEPWLATAEASGGLIFTTWNQTKSPKGADSVGTRTGRLSSTPNFQNIPKEFKALFKHEDVKLPAAPFELPPLPKVRSYIVPFEGEVFIDRDYSQQEPRILAHFDGGQLMDKYIENPWIDFHDYAKAELANMGKFYDRKPVKNTNLGLIYGMGVPKLAAKNDMSVLEAGELKKAILMLYPGLKEMYGDMKARASLNLPVRTWGGREYYCEPPRVVDGRLRQFDYKLVNVLIQGSAADCTKEAIIRYHRAKSKEARIVLNVHDQITASVPKSQLMLQMETMRVAMEGIEFDVPMLSEGAVSETNWDELQDYDKKGVLLWQPRSSPSSRSSAGRSAGTRTTSSAR